MAAPLYEVSAVAEALNLMDGVRGEKYSPFASELQLVDQTVVMVYRFNPVLVSDSLTLSTSLLSWGYRYTTVLVSDSLTLASSLLSWVYSYLDCSVEEALGLEVSLWSLGLPGLDEALGLVDLLWSYKGPYLGDAVGLADSVGFNIYKLYEMVLSLNPLDGVSSLFREYVLRYVDDGPPLFDKESSGEDERLAVSDGLSVSVTYCRVVRDSSVILEDVHDDPSMGGSGSVGGLVIGAGLATGLIIVAGYVLRLYIQRL